MAVRELMLYPAPVLRKKADPVVRFDENLAHLIDDLAESMYFYKGVGLAAPQIGVGLRAVVVDIDQREGPPKLIELINPTVRSVSDEGVLTEEGCLSFPGEWEQVKRPAAAVVAAFDRHGQPFEIAAEGLLARALLHEIDHLDGKLFVDYLSRIKRSLIDRRNRKRAKQAAS